MDRSTFWFRDSSSGCDHRFPSVAVQNYLRRFHGVEVDEDVPDDVFEDSDAVPRLSDDHPIRIEWPMSEEKETKLERKSR